MCRQIVALQFAVYAVFGLRLARKKTKKRHTRASMKTAINFRQKSGNDCPVLRVACG